MIADSPSNSFSFFEAFDSFMRNWFAQLPRIESGVWLAYAMHAKKGTGEAFPGLKTVAEIVDHKNLNHIRAARKKLFDRGLLLLVKDAEGDTPAIVRVASRNGTSPKSGLVPIRDER